MTKVNPIFLHILKKSIIFYDKFVSKTKTNFWDDSFFHKDYLRFLFLDIDYVLPSSNF